MTYNEFLLLQEYLVAALWPLIELWMVLFVAGGFLLALYHAMSMIVRTRIL
jgi:hypothetical protein